MYHENAVQSQLNFRTEAHVTKHTFKVLIYTPEKSFPT